MSRNTFTLSGDWRWKQRDPAVVNVLDELVQHTALVEQGSKDTKSYWRAATTSPSEIHVELLKAGLIPDPYKGFDEHKKEWLYSCSFDLSSEQLSSNIELEFEGLDTFCTAYLNGVDILHSENMFTPATVSLSPFATQTTPDQPKGIVGASVQAVVSALSPLAPSSSAEQPKHALKEGKNILLLHFKSALLEAQALEEKYGRVRAGSCNLGDPSRVYVRKAQFGWRWDWGPELMTVGPYRPIHLHTYKARISDIYAKASVSGAPRLSPSLAVTPTLRGNSSDVSKTEITLRASNGSTIKTETFNHISKIEWKFSEGEVKLWWPVGYGEQPLYSVEVALFDKDGNQLDKSTKRIGFRRVELIQEPLDDAPGTTFLFEVNGVRIFIGGSNWIPADNFLTTVTPERFRAWLQLLKDGNQNMVRIWGGGVYEPDCFYDICDELGLLVWQDFQFACGQYPAHKEFLASVEAEAEANVRRLRDHPSMALWCGNNEDYQQVFQWGISTLPAIVIYEKILPNVIEKLSGNTVPYHRGSPYGSVKEWDTADPTIGDVHQWEVWAGKGAPYQDWDIMGGRFVSEFGLPCLPDIRTIDYWLEGTDPSQRRVQSKAMQQHNKAGSHERRLAIYMNENFQMTGDLETYAYLTQIMQSEGVAGAYRAWRRDWKGRGKQYCAGVIVWQINDCWPVSSWAIVDYFLRPKPAYYTIAREMLPHTVGVKRTVQKNRENDRPRQFYEFGAFQNISASIEIWGTNSTLEGKDAILQISCVDLNSTWTHKEQHQATLLPNQSTEILAIPCPCPPQSNPAFGPDDDGDSLPTTSHSVIVSVVLLDKASGTVLSRYVDWPQPFRSYDFPDPKLSITVTGEQVTVSVGHPAKGVVLGVEGQGDEVKWSDNSLDVMPGEPQTVTARGLHDRKVTARWLGAK
ncbi:glycoside hydrolase [Ceratobasidium sp. AG-I]|nr:glycoside hydrolase [Ceratobasidium sp. AG-I]